MIPRSVAVRVSAHESGVDQHVYPSNKVATAYPSLLIFIPISIVRQYVKPLSFYFLIMTALSFFPAISNGSPYTQLVPVLLVLSVSVYRETSQERNRQREDNRTNSQITRINRDGKWVEVAWQNVCVGDVVLVAGDQPSPADLVLVASSSPGNTAYIQTTNLDGESNFKPRFGIDKAVVTLDLMTSKQVGGGVAVPSKSGHKPEIIVHADTPRSELDYFSGQAVFHVSDSLATRGGQIFVEPVSDDSPGSVVDAQKLAKKPVNMQPIEVCDLSIKNFVPRESVIKGAEWVVGIVVYTGSDTKVLLGQDKPRYKVSKIDTMTNRLVLAILALEIATAILSAIRTLTVLSDPRWWLFGTNQLLSRYDQALEAVLSGFACLVLIASMIPISMVVSLEIAKVFQAQFIELDVEIPGTKTPSQALNDDLGQIGYVLSDKTGTLTSNELVLKKATIGNVVYETLDEIRDQLGNNTSHSFIVSWLPNSKEELFVFSLVFCHDITPQWAGGEEEAGGKTKSDPNDFTITKMKIATKQERDIKSVEASLAASRAVSRVPSRDTSRRGSRANSLEIGGIERTTTSASSTHLRDIFKDLSYCGESPDEICLVNACARSFDRVLTKRTQSSFSVVLGNGGTRKFEIVKFFPFTNSRRRSSVVMSVKGEDTCVVFVKGSDDAMLPCCVFETAEDKEAKLRTELSVNSYAKESLRTLVFAYKTISRKDLVREKVLDFVESGLTLIGCTGTEDKLQEGVQGSIHRLRMAGIAVWMITGDKLDTAVEISKSANLISPEMHVVTIDIGQESKPEDVESSLVQLESALGSPHVCSVITGRSIGFISTSSSNLGLAKRLIGSLVRCQSVVVCRSTKDQKATVAKMIQDFVHSRVLVLAIGDGANDVPMIKQANVGIGIAGKEGRQAAQNADYVLTQFSHLERLLLFHGRLNYVRTSKMVIYFVFKNMLLVLPFIYNSLFVALSSSPTIISSTMALSFNTVLTSLPVFALGLFERDISPSDRLVGFGNVSARKLAQSYPKLYMTGRQNRMFSISAIGNMFFVALVMGIWVYLVALMPLNDMGAVNEAGKVLDHWGMSWVFFVSVFSIDTIAVVLISDGITAIMVWAVVYSFAVCFSYFVSDIFDPSNQSGDILHVLISGTWTIWPVVSLAALPPIMVLIAVKSWIYRFNPTARMIWQEAKRRAEIRTRIKARLGQQRNNFFTNQMVKRNKSILDQPRSAVYQPDRLEEGIRLLSTPRRHDN